MLCPAEDHLYMHIEIEFNKKKMDAAVEVFDNTGPIPFKQSRVALGEKFASSISKIGELWKWNVS